MTAEYQPTHIEWDHKFDLGIKSIDQQHKQLVVLMNDLYDSAINESRPKALIDFIIAELIDFTVYHLDFEADCLFRYDFEDVTLHLEEHELFKEKINWFKGKISSSATSVEMTNHIFNLWKFLHTWLFEHIDGSDRKFVDLLKKNGMK